MKMTSLLSLQADAGFTGKKYRTQDTKYGHFIGEYDTEDEAKQAALARPYTRVLSHPDPTVKDTDVKFNPDKER